VRREERALVCGPSLLLAGDPLSNKRIGAFLHSPYYANSSVISCGTDGARMQKCVLLLVYLLGVALHLAPCGGEILPDLFLNVSAVSVAVDPTNGIFMSQTILTPGCSDTAPERPSQTPCP